MSHLATLSRVAVPARRARRATPSQSYASATARSRQSAGRGVVTRVPRRPSIGPDETAKCDDDFPARASAWRSEWAPRSTLTRAGADASHFVALDSGSAWPCRVAPQGRRSTAKTQPRILSERMFRSCCRASREPPFPLRSPRSIREFLSSLRVDSHCIAFRSRYTASARW